MKGILKYFIWSIGLIIILYIGVLTQLRIEEYSDRTYNSLPIFIFNFGFPLLVGILIRLSLISLKIDRSSKWTINWAKLLGIGLPLLYIGMGPFLYYTVNLPTIASLMPTFYLSHFSPEIICGVICGYIVIDSLRKN